VSWFPLLSELFSKEDGSRNILELLFPALPGSAEVTRQMREFFNSGYPWAGSISLPERALPDSGIAFQDHCLAFSKLVQNGIIEKEVHYTAQMILIFQMGFVRPDEQQIVKIAGHFLKLWNDGICSFPLLGN